MYIYYSASFFHSYTISYPNQGNGAAHSGLGLPTSPNVTKTFPPPPRPATQTSTDQPGLNSLSLQQTHPQITWSRQFSLPPSRHIHRSTWPRQSPQQTRSQTNLVWTVPHLPADTPIEQPGLGSPPQQTRPQINLA